MAPLDAMIFSGWDIRQQGTRLEGTVQTSEVKWNGVKRALDIISLTHHIDEEHPNKADNPVRKDEVKAVQTFTVTGK